MVPAEVLGGVLTLAVGVVGRRVQDPRAVAGCSFVMAVGIRDAHEDGARRRASFSPRSVAITAPSPKTSWAR